MRNLIKVVVLGFLPFASWAAGGGIQLLPSGVDLGDRSSMQRGAKYYMNYCSGCHGLSFMRYQRMGEDLGISMDQLRENLLFATDKVEERMTVAMRGTDGESWFGVPPPDLSVVARSRGPDWLYSYLVTFYRDPNPTRPFGVNNLVFKDVGMPHVLWPVQGIVDLQRAERPAGVASEHPDRLDVSGDVIRVHTALELEDGSHEHVVDQLVVTTPGEFSPGQFRRAARDLTNFLTYVGEPAKLVRYKIGFWVLAFLAVLFVLSRAMYKEWWRDVH